MMSLERVALVAFLTTLSSGASADVEVNLGLEEGYRNVNMHWSIAGNNSGCCPNILSELTWSDVQASQLKGHFDLIFNKRIKIEHTAAYGIIFAGKNQDSDYYGNDKTLEYSRSNNDAGDGDLIDLSVGVSFLVGRIEDESVNRGVRFYPKVGYSYHEQNFTMTKGYQTWPATGSFSGLNSTYEAVWHGPWVGLALEVELSDSSFLGLEYQLHVAEYTGIGNWNLRDDFEHPKSFKHTAIGYGHFLDITYKKRLNRAWGWGVGLWIENWETDVGDDKVYLSDGSRVSTRLNEVVYSSSTLNLNVDYFFN